MEKDTKKVPQLKENYMEILKNGVMEKKSIIEKTETTMEELSKRLKREQKDRDSIKDKKSKQFETKQRNVESISKQLKIKTEEAKKLKEQTKNTVAIVRMGLQRNIDNLTQKILEIQNSKNDLEEEIKTLQTEKDKYEKAIEECATDSRIPEDKREFAAKRASEKVQELKDEIDLKKAKVIYISADIPEYMEQLNEMQYNLQYVDYDKIDKYKPKETSKDEKDEQQEENSSDNITKEKQSKASELQKKDEEIREQAKIINEEKAARKRAEAELKQIKAEKQRAEQEEAARKEQEEQARRKETNEPYREGEELPKEQTEEQIEEQIEDKKPILYIAEANGYIAYSKEALNDDVKYSTIKEAKSEKRAKYNRLNIKGICSEIAGKRIASVLLYNKINPSIIKALENEPEMIYAYIQSIYNKEPLPFKLIHNLEGRNMIQRTLAMRYTIAEKRSGAAIQISKELDKGREDNQQHTIEEDFSLLELLDNSDISEAQKTFIKNYAIMNGEDKAKMEYAHTLSDARHNLHIQKFKEVAEKLPGKDTEATRNHKEEVTIESLNEKGLFSEGDSPSREPATNANFIDRVGEQDGTIEKNAKKAAETKQEKLERYSNMEITEEEYQANLASHEK